MSKFDISDYSGIFADIGSEADYYRYDYRSQSIDLMELFKIVQAECKSNIIHILASENIITDLPKFDEHYTVVYDVTHKGYYYNAPRNSIRGINVTELYGLDANIIFVTERTSYQFSLRTDINEQLDRYFRKNTYKPNIKSDSKRMEIVRAVDYSLELYDEELIECISDLNQVDSKYSFKFSVNNEYIYFDNIQIDESLDEIIYIAVTHYYNFTREREELEQFFLRCINVKINGKYDG